MKHHLITGAVRGPRSSATMRACPFDDAMRSGVSLSPEIEKE